MSSLYQRPCLICVCAVILSAACPVNLPPAEELTFSCEDDEACSAGYTCVSGSCFPSHLDAGLAADAAVADIEAPERALPDAGMDAGPTDVTQDLVALDVAAPDGASADVVTTDSGATDQAAPDASALDSLVPDAALPDGAATDTAPTATPNPTDLALTVRYEEVWLYFTVPDYPGISCTVRSRSDGDYPADHNDGVEVQSFSSAGPQSLADPGLIADRPIHYAVFCNSALGWNSTVVPGANADIATPLPAWWLSGYDWQRRRRLVIDNSARGQLVEVPVLVHLTAGRIAYNLCEADGADLRFVDADGTELDYEIDEWNPAGSSYLWVKIPRLDAGVATGYVYMYYDNDGVDAAQRPAAVWSNGYTAVYHLGADLLDSTAGAHHGQLGATSTLDQTPGQIGQGRVFDGVNDYIVLPDEAAFDLSAGFTISLWFRVDSFAAPYQTLIAKGMQAWQLARDDSNSHLAFGTTRANNQTLSWLPGTADVSGGGWFLVSAVFDDAGNDRLLYLGADQDGADNFIAALNATDEAVHIGDNGQAAGRRFDGVIDEVRVSSAVRSGDWIAAQHASMSGALITFAASDENL